MWIFEHSVECSVSASFAWRFWTNVENWKLVDASLESVKLSGPFALGSSLVTKPRGGNTMESRIVALDEGTSVVLETLLPDTRVKFFWRFDASILGTRITQKIMVEHAGAEQYRGQWEAELETGVPAGMQKLADVIVRAAQQPA